MRVKLNYGKGHLAVELPPGCRADIISKPDMPVLAGQAGLAGEAANETTDALTKAVTGALANPVQTPPLAQAARGKKTACILICDITRPVPNGVILPPLIRELLAAGVPASGITVLVATGLHRPNEGQELAELVGNPWVLETVRVENHFARNDEDHLFMGETSRKTRVSLDKRFVNAELRIVTGLVEPHFMAGYSGGRKVIAPGVAHAETITTFHSARFMEHPSAANCLLEGNPLHEEQLEIVAMLGGALAMNVVIDEARRISFLNYGEIIASHLQAVDFVQAYARVAVPRRYRTVLTSAAGYPLDKTYYQTVKGMVAAMDILEPGGNLLIVSDCSEGMGSAEYVQAQQRLISLGPNAFLESLTGKTHADIDEWQTEMQLKPMRVGGIHLYSGGLQAALHPLTGVNMVDDPAKALAALLAQGDDNTLAVIPEGPYVVPYHAP